MILHKLFNLYKWSVKAKYFWVHTLNSTMSCVVNMTTVQCLCILCKRQNNAIYWEFIPTCAYYRNGRVHIMFISASVLVWWTTLYCSSRVNNHRMCYATDLYWMYTICLQGQPGQSMHMENLLLSNIQIGIGYASCFCIQLKL